MCHTAKTRIVITSRRRRRTLPLKVLHIRSKSAKPKILPTERFKALANAVHELGVERRHGEAARDLCAPVLIDDQWCRTC